MPLQHSLFALDAVVLTDTPRTVTLSSPKGHHGVTVAYPDMPYIGFWQPNRGQLPFLCIEPWSALPGRQDVREELFQMEDMMEVPAGGQHLCRWSITVW